jgi:hypothetical protein
MDVRARDSDGSGCKNNDDEWLVENKIRTAAAIRVANENNNTSAQDLKSGKKNEEADHMVSPPLALSFSLSSKDNIIQRCTYVHLCIIL